MDVGNGQRIDDKGNGRMKMSELLEEWKKRDPLLADVGGFQRFSDAHELKRLIRLGHPNQHGEEYTRSDVISMIAERGGQLLEDLGWPTSWLSEYRNTHTGRVETLESALKWLNDGLDPLRSEMHRFEERINALTDGELYDGFAARGLETYKVTELKKLVKKFPFIDELVRRSVILHKGFYERCKFGQETALPLTDDFFKADESVKNIASHCRWLGIDINEIVPDKDLPPRNYWTHLFSVLEHWEPVEE